METLWVGMSPYCPHCAKSNKNSVLLKAKKVVPCMWKAPVPFCADHSPWEALLRSKEQNRAKSLFLGVSNEDTAGELNASPGQLASATPHSLQAVSLSRGVPLRPRLRNLLPICPTPDVYSPFW